MKAFRVFSQTALQVFPITFGQFCSFSCALDQWELTSHHYDKTYWNYPSKKVPLKIFFKFKMLDGLRAIIRMRGNDSFSGLFAQKFVPCSKLLLNHRRGEVQGFKGILSVYYVVSEKAISYRNWLTFYP